MTSAAVDYGGGGGGGGDDIAAAAAAFNACEARRLASDGRLIKYYIHTARSLVRSPIGQTGQSAQLLLLLNIVRARVCVCARARVARAAL